MNLQNKEWIVFADPGKEQITVKEIRANAQKFINDALCDVLGKAEGRERLAAADNLQTHSHNIIWLCQSTKLDGQTSQSCTET